MRPTAIEHIEEWIEGRIEYWRVEAVTEDGSVIDYGSFPSENSAAAELARLFPTTPETTAFTIIHVS